MIIVTGATGQLGGLIVERLLDLMPAGRIGVSVRNPAKAQALAKRGVRVRQGDFAEPDSLPVAFEGASQVLVVSSNARAVGGDTLSQHQAAIAAARTAGVQRIVYTSHMAAAATSAFPPMHDHMATEDMLRQSGLAWTALRNGFYAESVPLYLGDAMSSRHLAVPQDGKVAWTSHADLAAGAARILVDEGRFDGPTPPLTASRAQDFNDIAQILGDLTGHPVARQLIADDMLATRLAALSMPPSVVRITLGFYQAARLGEFSATHPTLRELIGREPAALRDLLAGLVLKPRC